MEYKNDSIDLCEIMQDFDSIYEYYAKQYGINSTTMYLLYIVHISDGCTQKDICEKMLLPKQTVNSIVKDYQRKGLLEAVELSGDRRHKHIRLTKQGKEYCDKILPPIIEAEAYAIEQFSEEECRLLFSLLGKYKQAFKEKVMKSIHLQTDNENKS